MTRRIVQGAFAVAAVAAAALSVTAAPPPTASVSGFVGGGKAGAPLAGAEVVAVGCRDVPSESELSYFIRPAEPVLAKATTAADGTFRIDGLPGGRCALIVRKAGQLVATAPGVPLTPGKVTPSVWVRASPPYTTQGRIVRKDGGPVAGLEVVASTDRDVWFGGHDVTRTRTAGDGTYSISGLPAAVTAVIAPDGKSSWRARAGRGPDDPYEARPGDASVAVTVVDAQGAPVKGAAVTGSGEDCLATGTTDAAGKCLLAGLASKFTIVSVRASGFAPACGEGLSKIRKGAMPELRPGANEQRIVLDAGCTVRGAVTDAASKKPLAGARVGFASLTTVFSEPLETLTDANGRFEFTHVPAETGLLLVALDGWRQTEVRRDATWRWFKASWLGKQTGTAPSAVVVLAKPGDKAEPTIALDAAPPMSGTLRDPEGKSVPGARVSVLVKAPFQQWDVPRSLRSFVAEMYVTFTDADGRYALPVATAGDEVQIFEASTLQFELPFGKAPRAVPQGPVDLTLEKKQ